MICFLYIKFNRNKSFFTFINFNLYPISNQCPISKFIKYYYYFN